jgi:two-component system, chemotaxis family, chemotaxis protein CheY
MTCFAGRDRLTIMMISGSKIMAKIIFLVDDSATMLMSVKNTLEMAGYKVETAEDGVKAMAKLTAGLKPDLIITDINMPNMGGIELIKKARALPGFRFLPILTLTTESQQSRRDEGKQAGATGWLVKPVGGADLLKVIKQVLPGA